MRTHPHMWCSQCYREYELYAQDSDSDWDIEDDVGQFDDDEMGIDPEEE